MRAIEAEINKRRAESGRRSEIPLTNFRGIELRDFPAEIARLALIIAEYQCDVLYRGQKEALQDFLPLDAENWITCGNALRLDWLSICPPTGTGVKHHAEDLFHSPLDQAQINLENEGGEAYICGNPPYVGDKFQTEDQKSDLRFVSKGKRGATELPYAAASGRYRHRARLSVWCEQAFRANVVAPTRMILLRPRQIGRDAAQGSDQAATARPATDCQRTSDQAEPHRTIS